VHRIGRSQAQKVCEITVLHSMEARQLPALSWLSSTPALGVAFSEVVWPLRVSSQATMSHNILP
jgi:hypothetical protein